jgi:glyoxylase-like metal-dependent hydrolase (beta-lactamase superfamily II)
MMAMWRLATAVGILLACVSGVSSGQERGTPAGFRPVDGANHPDLFVWTDTCNVYVLRSGDQALLIDLGDGSVLKQLTEIGVKRVSKILLTHHHREQFQGIDLVDRNVTQVAGPKDELPLFETPNEFRKWFPSLGDPYTVYGASFSRPPRLPVKLDQPLAANDKLTWNDWEITCLSTPGHSPGSLTYVVRRNGRTVAFSGDVIHDGPKMVTWFDTEWDYGFAKGIDVLLASVELLQKQDVSLLLPAHGPPITNTREQLATYHHKLTEFRKTYIRGYPVFDIKPPESDPISKPTPIPLINQVTPHLYKLSHKLPGKNFAILISDRGRGLILDAGLFSEAQLDEIILGLREHAGLKEIDAFWISHMHGDHFLLGPMLKKKYGAQAWTLDKIVDKLENPRRYDYAALVSAYKDGFDGMKVDRSFRDGETIEWEGYKLHIDWMPGQTEFGNCLWLEIDGKRIAFTGDNLFGNSADPMQDGHEAVVARNSSILEEGYIYGSKYIRDLKPDIVMGSHSYVMPEPAAFLQRYHEWSKRMRDQFQDLLPEKNYEYLYDPYWVSAYPYRVDLSAANTETVQITIRNHRDAPQQHRVVLKLPPGVTAEPPVLEGTIAARTRQTFPVKLTVDRAKAQPIAGPQQVTFDITLDGRRWGEMFDFLIRTR